jgi:hypothetical protein
LLAYLEKTQQNQNPPLQATGGLKKKKRQKNRKSPCGIKQPGKAEMGFIGRF